MGARGENNRIAIAVIGAGKIGAKHIALVTESNAARLACIVEPTESGEHLSRLHGVAHFKDLSELFGSRTHIDAAIICTPNSTHAQIGADLAARGVHLLVEKPLSTTAAEGEKLLHAGRDYGVSIVTGHHRRHNSAVQSALKALKDGRVGKVIGVSGLWVSLKRGEYFAGAGKWRTQPGGGVVLINLIHEVDLLQMFLGPINRVYAEEARSTRGHEAEEGVAVTLRFESGVIGTFLALDSSPSPHNIEACTGEQACFPFSGQDSYRFFGERGTLSVPDNTCWTPRYLEEGRNSVLDRSKIEAQEASDAYERQLSNFIAVVQGKEAAICDGEAGLRAVKVCEAIYKSLRDSIPYIV